MYELKKDLSLPENLIEVKYVHQKKNIQWCLKRDIRKSFFFTITQLYMCLLINELYFNLYILRINYTSVYYYHTKLDQ